MPKVVEASICTGGLAPPRPKRMSGSRDALRCQAIHHGKGVIGVTPHAFFDDRQTPYFVTFDMPPGSSEGVHVHGEEDASEGWLDEYYYIISGHGVMQIGDEIIAISEGDFFYTPAGTYHGIENTTQRSNLKVMLTVIGVRPACSPRHHHEAGQHLTR